MKMAWPLMTSREQRGGLRIAWRLTRGGGLAGKSEDEVLDYVYKCVNDGLPAYQKALPQSA